MNLKPSPFAPPEFPHLPHVKGVKAATHSRGFYAHRGLERDDVFLFAFDEGTTCAGVYTLSTTASADVQWCREALATGTGTARGLVVNSGNSNAFTGAKGKLKNDATLAAMQAELGGQKHEHFLAATGVIGEPLSDPNYVGSALPDLTKNLGPVAWQACAQAFMTTDTFAKGAGDTCEIDGIPVALAGIAKGSGMIAPNMATMLAYIFTDAAISSKLLDELIREATDLSFNSITVDSDTSTSDTFMVFATGASGAPMITERDDPRLSSFEDALKRVSLNLALQIVKDGEGASKIVTIHVSGAETDRDAKTFACDVANSPLVKTALAASDANWGRVVMALGKSGNPLDQDKLAIWFGDVQVAEKGGRTDDYNEAAASAECAKPFIDIRIEVGDGGGQATVYTCDLTHGYIDINGAYRT